MKKLILKLTGIKEILNAEQMKKVNGGYGDDCCTEACCWEGYGDYLGTVYSSDCDDDAANDDCSFFYGPEVSLCDGGCTCEC